MALTVSTPSTGTRIGPGSDVEVHSSAVGPFPTDDYFSVTAYTHATFPFSALVYGNARIFSSSTRVVRLGISQKVVGISDFYRGASDNSDVYLHLEHFHNNGVTVDVSDPTGVWKWDAVSNLWLLVGVPASTGDSAKIDAILNAVVRTWPAP